MPTTMHVGSLGCQEGSVRFLACNLTLLMWEVKVDDMSSNSAQPPPNPSPGAWLTRQMERRSISVRQLAEALGVTEKTIYFWRDDKTAVSEPRIPVLAETLGLSEIAARRGLGYWVPVESSEPAGPQYDVDELRDLREQLSAIIDRIEEMQRRQR